MNYRAKTTNYGRLRISKIIDADVDKIGIFSNEFERISAKSAAKLSLYLNQFEDGVEKRKALTKFALRVVTLAGVKEILRIYIELLELKKKELAKKIIW